LNLPHPLFCTQQNQHAFWASLEGPPDVAVLADDGQALTLNHHWLDLLVAPAQGLPSQALTQARAKYVQNTCNDCCASRMCVLWIVGVLCCCGCPSDLVFVALILIFAEHAWSDSRGRGCGVV
jgi:hypothetical protein